MKNWQTSLIGIVGGLLTAWATGGFDDVKKAIPGVAIALIGLFAKDHNVTGGTRPQ